MRLVGRALRCRLRPLGATAPAGIVGLTLLPSEGTADARLPVDPFLNERIVVLPDGGLYSTFIDRFNSHCTEYHPGATALDEGVEAFGRVRYLPNSAGACNEFSEDIYLTASPRLPDVLPSFAGRRPSAGRAAISNRVVFDHWRMQPGEARAPGDMAGWDDRHSRALAHQDALRHDRKQPQFRANPTAGQGQFRAAIACHDLAGGWRCTRTTITWTGTAPTTRPRLPASSASPTVPATPARRRRRCSPARRPARTSHAGRAMPGPSRASPTCASRRGR